MIGHGKTTVILARVLFKQQYRELVCQSKRNKSQNHHKVSLHQLLF